MSNPTYVLDTDISSYFIKGRYRSIDRRIDSLAPAEFAISVMTRAELMFGLKKLPSEHVFHLMVRRFLGGVQILDWGQDAGDIYAGLRHQLKDQNTSIGELDVMIAAHAISLNAILVTNNVKHFGRLAPLLQIENWVSEA